MTKLKPKVDNSTLKKQRLAFGIILAIAVVAYNFIWLNRTFTLSEGWAFFYNGLLAEGKVPYRDFYYYLPPLNLLIDYIIWKLSSGYFIIYRLIRLAERVLIVEIMYSIISKKVDPFISFVGCVLSTIMASANVYDLVGDYNQTVQLLTALLCVFVMKYAENFDNIKKRCFWMFLIGICGGCMFLSKQTIVVACAIVFVGLIFLLLITKTEKNIFKMIFSVGFGLAIPLGICFIYFVATRSLTEFINQVFMDTSSKGSLVEIVYGTQKEIVLEKAVVFVLLISMFIVCTKISDRLAGSSLPIKSKHMDFVFCLLAGVVFSYSYSSDILYAFEMSRKSIVLFIFIALIALVSFVNVEKLYGKIISVLALLATVAVMFMNIENYTEQLYNNTGIFKMIASIATFVHCLLVLWMVQHIAKHFIKKTPFAFDSMVIACAGLASGWATAMTNGEHDVLTSTAFISIPALIYIIFKNKTISNQIYVKALVISTVLVMSICTAQKIVCPYSWWGDVEETYYDKTESSQIEALKGFKMSKNEKNRIDEITNIIEKNTDENSTIFGFPYIKIYNVFLENYNMDNFVPVLFYDVCSDDYAKKDAKLLAKNQPDIVVWHDIPSCMRSHEDIFRDGDILGQRKIQKWFYQASKTDYELIGQVDNIFVYKLKESGKPAQTYIERKTRVNETLKKSDLRTVENTLKGSGTKDDPYLISSQKDLLLFRKLVNQGMTFYDEYVEQTADIDLSNIENWTPIGIYQRHKYFQGTYNGNGYKISNLTITYDEKKDMGYVGLFGQLYGKVENVYLENCDISGKYIGAIASNATYTADIYNCYVSGKLNATKRAGGIVDNSSATVANCVTECTVTSKKASGISGYYNSTVENCYSIYGNDVSVDDGYKLDKDTLKKLNENISSLESEDKDIELNTWEIKSGKLELTNSKAD
ncbi:MAG: hypothetical protein ACI4RR_08380 [Eubacterium sp.]